MNKKNVDTTFTVLVACMNKNAKELISEMNIDSDAIVINQCLENSYEEYTINNSIIKSYSFKEKGVGLSRNNALMRVDSKYALFADEDEIFVDDYKKVVLEEFEKNKKADIIIFNLRSLNKNRPLYNIKRSRKLNSFNSMKYGAARIAIKVSSIKKYNLYFNLLFGGGAMYGSGEDSIFIHDCLKKGLKIYSSNKVIANVKQESSSWFNGYNEKYFRDKGALLKRLYGKKALIMYLYFIIKYSHSCKNIGKYKLYKLMIQGGNAFNEKSC